MSYLDGVTSNIQTQINNKLDSTMVTKKSGVGWNISKSISGATFTCCLSIGSYYIACTAGGQIYFSSDGTTWILKTTLTGEYIVDITYAKCIYKVLILTQSGKIYACSSYTNPSSWSVYATLGTSVGVVGRIAATDSSSYSQIMVLTSDGIIFYTGTTGDTTTFMYQDFSSQTLTDIVFDPGFKAFIISGYGYIYYTTVSNTPTFTLQSVSISIYSLCAVGNIVYGCGASGRIVKATSPTNWEVLTTSIPTSLTLLYIGFVYTTEDISLIVVSNDGTFYYSPIDGSSWSEGSKGEYTGTNVRCISSIELSVSPSNKLAVALDYSGNILTCDGSSYTGSVSVEEVIKSLL